LRHGNKITKQQRDELLASHGQPIPVEDEVAHKVYYLVDADYLHTSREHLKALIQEGVDASQRPAEEVEEELRQYADQIDSKRS
jgi:Mg2+ and Co2+ transporter CorA